MSSFSIQSESDDNLGPVELSGTLLVGRGPLFKVFHKSVSRNHAELIVDSVASVLLVKSVHSNPTFVYKVGSDKTVVLNKGEKIELCHDDKFSLLPKEIFFRVINSRNNLSTNQTLSPKLDGSSSTQDLDLDPLENFDNPADITDTSFLASQNLETSDYFDIDPLETVKIPTDNTETLYLPSEPNDTQELDIDLLETVKILTDNTETLYLPSEPNDTQELDIDPLETVKIPTDNTETLYLPSEPNDTQELDIDPLETVKIPTDNTETLYLPSEPNDTQELDIDPLETVKIPTDNTETLYLPSEPNDTQELDIDPLGTVKIPTDNTETLYLPSEPNDTQELDIDPLETVKIPTDNTETLYLPSEPNDTQELDIDPLGTVKIPTDNTETLYLPSEPNDTQELDIDPLGTVKIPTDNTETLYLPSEPNGTQELDIDPLGTVKIPTDNTETLYLPSDLGKATCMDVAKPSSSLTRESMIETNSCSSDSTATTEGSITHKKRKLPVWMLEETKTSSPMKKVKSKTDAKIVTKSSDDVCKPDELSTDLVATSTPSTDTTELVKPDTTPKPVSDIPTLPTTSTSVLPVCPYGADCYRKNPTHLAGYSHSAPSATGKSKVCPYGPSCYRKNPDHFKEFSHPTKASLTRDKKPRAAKAKKKSVLDGTSDDDGDKNSYNLKDDFIDDSGSADESASTEVETSESEEWQPADDVTDLLEEANDFVKNPKMLRK